MTGRIMRVSYCFKMGGGCSMAVGRSRRGYSTSTGARRPDRKLIDFAAAECAAHATPGQCIKGIGALVEMAHGMSRSWGIPKRGGGGVEAMRPHLTKHAPQGGMDKGE